MDEGSMQSIYYYKTEGKQHINQTVQLSIKRAKELDIKTLIIFTANGEGAFTAKELLGSSGAIRILAATFPYKQPFFTQDSEGKSAAFLAGTSNPEIRDKLKKQKIDLIQGVMPFQEIIIPGAKDIKTQAINSTLSLFSKGLKLCIQGILMATDGGHIEPGEHVISMSADTSIVARSSSSIFLFHPTQGLDICEIICKPNIMSRD